MKSERYWSLLGMDWMDWMNGFVDTNIFLEGSGGKE
jgi:hypothetical protein